MIQVLRVQHILSVVKVRKHIIFIIYLGLLDLRKVELLVAVGSRLANSASLIKDQVVEDIGAQGLPTINFQTLVAIVKLNFGTSGSHSKETTELIETYIVHKSIGIVHIRIGKACVAHGARTVGGARQAVGDDGAAICAHQFTLALNLSLPLEN